MILPIGDTPNPEGTPWVTWALILVNVVVHGAIAWQLSLLPADPGDPLFKEYFATFGHLQAAGGSYAISAYDVFVYAWGYRSAQPAVGDLFASLFLHAGWMHLLGNMLFLWIYGDNVEARLGHVRFLLFYLVAGVGATLFYGWLTGPSPVPLIGASGAISGVLGAYAVWFPHNQVKVAMMIPRRMGVFLIPAWIMLGIYLVLDNLLPLALGVSSGTAYGAHVGGFLVGLAVALPLRSRAPSEGYADPAVPHLLAGEKALAAGQKTIAFNHFMTALKRASHEGVRDRALDGLSRVEDPRLQAWLARNHHRS